jgi:surface protein
VYSLSLSVSHGTFRCGVLLKIYDISWFVGSQVLHVLFFLYCGCGLKRDLVVVVCVWWVGSFFSLLHPFSLLAVFYEASAFNQDVSKWNTGAVTSMVFSKCTLSLSVATPSVVVYFEYTTTRVSSDHTSHTFCSFCICVYETGPFVVFVWWVWSFFSFCCILLSLLLQCLLGHLRSIQTCPTGIRGR